MRTCGQARTGAQRSGHSRTRHCATCPCHAALIWLTVPEAVAYCEARGLSRNIKTIRRWAARSLSRPENAEVTVREEDTENGFRYVIERQSLDRKIAQELAFEAQRTAADMTAPIQTAPDAPGQAPTSQGPRTCQAGVNDSEPASTPVRTEPDMSSRQLKVTSVGDDFLKDQIGQKDTQITELNDQLKRRDEQIMTMLERDRETNYLINGLQQALSQSLGIEAPTACASAAKGTTGRARRRHLGYNTHHGGQSLKHRRRAGQECRALQTTATLHRGPA